jgi:photosystem II stability/assembly factor-like uncharacterized protein
MSLEDRLRSTIDEHVRGAAADAEAWNHLQQRLNESPAAPPTTRRSSRIVTAVVAFAVFIAGAAFVWQAFAPGPTAIHPASDTVAGTTLWPERSGAVLAKTQGLADAGAQSVAWRLDPKEVAGRFADEILGWGPATSATGGIRYVVRVDPSWKVGDPSALVTVSQLAPPCPSPPPGQAGTCPPPFSSEAVTVRQLGTTGEGGIWSVTSVVASDLSLRLAPGQQVANGTQVDGAISFASTWQAVTGFHAQAGYHVGTRNVCDVSQANDAPQGNGALLSVSVDPNACNETTPPGYAWIETGTDVVMPSGSVKDPLRFGGNAISPRFYGLTLVPFTLSVESATQGLVLPADPCQVLTETQVADATGGRVTTSGPLSASDLKSPSQGVPLPCRYRTDSPFGAILVTVDPAHLTAFTSGRDRDPSNTMTVPNLGDESFLSSGSSIWVRVGDGYFSIGSQLGAGTRAVALLETLANDALQNIHYSRPTSPSPSPDETVSATPVPPVVQYSPLGVQFWDRTRGVIVGATYCRRCDSGTGGFIATTADGGRTWHLTNDSYPPFNTVSIVPGGVAYAAAGSMLVTSSDYGETWAKLGSTGVVSPSFSSANDGWAASSKNQITAGGPLLHTTDGGRSWQAVPSPCPSVGPQIQGLSFPSPAEGWVLCVGEPGAGNQWKAVYRTSDAGGSWTKVYGSGFDYGYAQQVSFLPDGHGWLLFSIRGQPERTVDYGAHWAPSDVVQPEVSQLVAVSFLNAEEGFAVRWMDGTSGLLHTRNGGQSWTFVSDIRLPK